MFVCVFVCYVRVHPMTFKLFFRKFRKIYFFADIIQPDQSAKHAEEKEINTCSGH